MALGIWAAIVMHQVPAVKRRPVPFNPEICAMSSMGGREFIRDLSVGPSHLENSVLRLDPFSPLMSHVVNRQNCKDAV